MDVSLTRYSCRKLECLGDFGVDLDHEILLHRDLVVPLIGLLLDPFSESVFQYGGADVRNPILGRLGQLNLRLREIIVDFSVVGQEEELDFFEAEALIPRGY